MRKIIKGVLNASVNTTVDKVIRSSDTSLEDKLALIERSMKTGRSDKSEGLTLLSKAIASKGGSRKYPALISAIKETVKKMDEKVITEINGHAFVEMGDGLKWATCNVGASKPEEFGDYFSWGDTEPYYLCINPLIWKDGIYEGYGKASNKHYEIDTENRTATLLKYTNSDGKTVLEPEDDAAAVNWKGSWRMPTAQEFEKLANPDNFTWTEETLNGVNVVRITSKVKGYEGNSIVLPKASDVLAIYFRAERHPQCLYWTSTRDIDVDRAMRLYCNNGKLEVNWTDRMLGMPVRPVSE